jgi:hypothetical protein
MCRELVLQVSTWYLYLDSTSWCSLAPRSWPIRRTGYSQVLLLLRRTYLLRSSEYSVQVATNTQEVVSPHCALLSSPKLASPSPGHWHVLNSPTPPATAIREMLRCLCAGLQEMVTPSMRNRCQKSTPQIGPTRLLGQACGAWWLGCFPGLGGSSPIRMNNVRCRR